jgi:hypothetical protein
VAVEFDNVLTRVTRRSFEIEQQSVIDRAAIGIQHGNQLRLPWCEAHRQPGDQGSHLQRLRA